MNINEQEKKILDFWKKEKIFEKSLAKTKNAPAFVFYDGPITVNARPGIHHIEARAYKDIIPRYKTMKGFCVERKNGWDTHGLPVELEVEKKLGFKSKKDIENYGIAKFNQECQKTVDKLIPVFREMTERIGYWVDVDDPYITYKPEYIESLWWILKQIWDKGLLYEDFKVVPWCSRCGTGLSSHELALGYQKIQENSVYIKLKVSKSQKIKDVSLGKNTYLLSWTTTPWTLPGNVALAVDPDMDYVLVKKDKDCFILAKSRLSVLGENYEILKQFKGKDFESLGYEPLFNIKKLQSGSSHKVYPASFVTKEDGTGIVHTAVMYGADDFELGQKYNLPKVHTVNQQGLFNELVEGFKNKKVKDKETEKSLIEYLKKNNLLFKEETISHDYPFCWRCKEPLLYYAKESWFIKVTEVQDKLLKANKEINWIPGHLKEGRFGEWLKSVKDWAITRERYWGTPFPVWRCSACNKTTVIGSFEELEKLSKKKLEDPHRPYVDEISFKCSACDKEMKREPYVVDVWFDSGAMPFAQYHYPFEQKSCFDKLPFPADYISEAIDQTRGWFYTLLAVSTLLGYGSPYKNVLCLGHVLDQKGEKMSKSKGNIVDYNQIIDRYGADALRWYFFNVNQPNDPKRFKEKDVRVAFRQLALLKNCLKFLDFYSLGKDVLGLSQVPKKPRAILDQWLLFRLQETAFKLTDYLENFEITKAARSLDDLISDLSYKYIHWSRERFRVDGPLKEESLLILAKVLLELSRLLAPFVPFIAETIYQKIVKLSKNRSLSQSVHLTDWIKAKKLSVKERKLLDKIKALDQFISLGLRARKVAGLRVRQPLTEIIINQPLDASLFEILKNELNVKKATYQAKIDRRKSWIYDQEDKYQILLNPVLTQELKEEGALREVLRNIQLLRKAASLSPVDKIILYCFSSSSEISHLLTKNLPVLKQACAVQKIKLSCTEEETQLKSVFSLLGSSVKIGIKKV